MSRVCVPAGRPSTPGRCRQAWLSTTHTPLRAPTKWRGPDGKPRHEPPEVEHLPTRRGPRSSSTEILSVTPVYPGPVLHVLLQRAPPLHAQGPGRQQLEPTEGCSFYGARTRNEGLGALCTSTGYIFCV
ncbi:hypothetical protein NDU88_004516 [Pleurodeles waltl]|uniref:Uncharacterized protein n=1 Tax=Pleurodeles waltl TaxID=8319 RepID=A0AAV7L046_PLEWA|nr:hypothetical protein NDU88_004516 [Pleurodeles waltl]